MEVRCKSRNADDFRDPQANLGNLANPGLPRAGAVVTGGARSRPRRWSVAFLAVGAPVLVLLATFGGMTVIEAAFGAILGLAGALLMGFAVAATVALVVLESASLDGCAVARKGGRR